MDIYGYVAMLAVGASLGLIGGGGAILTVPIMVYLFNTSVIVATSYSLFVVGASSLFGVWRYHQEKLVDYRTALTFAAPSFLGTYVARRVLMPILPEVIFRFGDFDFKKDQLVMTVFAVVMLAASIAMIRSAKNSEVPITRAAKRSRFLLPGLGFVVGFVAGFVGAGGGFLIIPALVIFAQVPMAMAVGTSLLIIAANSLVGFGGDVLAGNVMDWRFLAVTTSIALVGIFAGSYAARFVPASKLKPAFGWFVLVMGIYIMGRQIVS